MCLYSVEKNTATGGLPEGPVECFKVMALDEAGRMRTPIRGGVRLQVGELVIDKFQTEWLQSREWLISAMPWAWDNSKPFEYKIGFHAFLRVADARHYEMELVYSFGYPKDRVAVVRCQMGRLTATGSHMFENGEQANAIVGSEITVMEVL